MKKIFSLIPVYAVVSVVYFFALAFGGIQLSEGWALSTGIISFIVALFTVISSVSSVFTHVSELGTLRQRVKEVSNAEEFLKEMKEHVKMITDSSKELDEGLLAKSNVDHPIVSALSQLNNAQRQLRDSKNQLAYVEGYISARKAGPFKWVVDMYGEK